MAVKRGKSVSQKKRASTRKGSGKKAAPKRKAAAKKKAAPKRKAAAKKKAARIRSWPDMLSTVTVPVDTAIYPLEAVLGACYVFMDRSYVHLTPIEGKGVEVMLSGKGPLDETGLRALGGEFANELVDQMLRVTLDESGRKLREYIVAKAHFFQDEGGQDVKRLLDTTMEEAFDEDPLDIAVPWEEKYGQGGDG
jgi:His-Xaa-Ser system protein HxsD